MKYTPEYSSRFRILKGGKISLVVSALLVSSSMVGPSANAADLVAGVTMLTEDTTLTTTADLTTSDGQYTVDLYAGDHSVDIAINHDITNTSAVGYPRAVHIRDLGEDSSITIAQDATLSTAKQESVVLEVRSETEFALIHSTLTNHGTIESTSASTAIRINGNLVGGSSITNSATGEIIITSTDGSEYELGSGIEVRGNLEDSAITNAGLINVQTKDYAYGIHSDGRYLVGESSISNTGTIETNAERTVETDQLGGWTVVSSQGIVFYGLGDTSTIENSGLIKSDAFLDLTINDNQFGMFHTTAIAKGISIGNDWDGSPVNGTDPENMASIINGGSIEVTATLNTRFGEDNFSLIGNTWGLMFGAKASGIEAGEVRYGIIENSVEGSITSLAEVSVENGEVYYYDGTFAVSNGIKVDRLEESSILNFGTIDSQAIFSATSRAEAYAYGIHVDGDVENSTVENGGLIDVDAIALSDEDRAEATAYGIRVYGDVENSTVENVDLIDVNAIALSDGDWANARAYGIRTEGVRNAMIVNGDHTSDEIKVTATAQGVEDEAFAYAYGIYLDDFENSTLINNGKIDVSATADSYDYTVARANGIFLYTSGEDSFSNIINNGTIKANAAGTQIEENYYSVKGYGVRVNHLTNGDFALENSGTIEASINNELDKDGYSLDINSYYYDRVTVANSGTLKGNINVEGSLTNNGASVSQKANIELAHNAMGEDSAYIHDFTNGQFGQLTIGVLTDGEIENTTYSQLRTDYATFAEGSTIAVNVLEASTGVALLVGERLENVVTAYNALTIDGTLNITDNSALLNFELVTSSAYGEDWLGNGEDGAIHLDIVQGTTIFDSTVAGGGNSPAKAAASALQTIQDNGVQESMTGFFEALNGLETDAQVAAAVLSTAPATNTATSTANNQIMNGIQGIVEMRQNSVMGMSSGDKSLRDQNLWAKVYGSRGSQETKEGINGFDVNAFGIGFGADAEIGAKQRIGAALFYTDADVDVNGVNQKSDVKVYTAMVYGNIPMNANTDFLYQGGYSWQKTETKRNVFGIGTANGDYTAKTASLDLKVMKTYPIDKALTLRPLVETTYRHYTSPSYSESGAGGMNLNIEKFTSTQLIMGAGVIAEYKTGKNEKLIADISVGYDLHHEKQSVNASYQGAPSVTFTTNGIDNGGWQYDIGLGYEEANVLGGELNFMYNYQGQGSGFDNHVLSAKYVWKF
jgi:uncharacterized protein with beta-barrel porin domain